ncbi:hypothetical protein BCR35DRAFT_352714 [Leucosporidium creatinivorum]|uniref:Uncharacterized protein n=1 Tax=Leucosporidium creatinivorum TaxID=106004 RepID=A0A1Y2F5Y9_9BASI|nr:hypothetical protein BCR35DRAFT_352714 [Leucosporidium creatinivorum]
MVALEAEPIASTPASTNASPDNSDGEVGSGQKQAEGAAEATAGAGKAKKKKKRKTPAQKRAAAEAALAAAQAANPPPPPVLKISRNKHMKYISSYHGPWLQLPHEVLDSLLTVNCDPANLPTVRGLLDTKSSAYALSDRSRFKTLPPTPPPIDMSFLSDEDERLPPPIDPAAFRGVGEIRKLVDDASDLAVRAASGMSAAALGAFNPSSSGMGSGGEQQGMGSLGGSGRNATMSPVRQHRLRALAVGKLAEAYKIDEIAASVCVMQSATGLDDLAQRVLKYEPESLDAQYVHFFHEKIPSRTLALSTDTTLLDQLILSNPHRLEYYRTRGIVHGFKQDYPAAIRNFTQALVQAKATRKAKAHHAEVAAGTRSRKKGRGGRGKGKHKEDSGTATNGGADSPSASTPAREEATSIGKEPGDDLERQMLFHRGMAHFHYACKLLEDAALDIEGVEKPSGGLSNEGGELTLRNVGIVLKDEVAGLYGCASPKKQERYRNELGDPALREKVTTLLRKSLRDQERFLSYFAVWEAPAGSVLEEEKRYQNPRSTDKPLTFRGRRLIHHRALSNRTRHSDPRRPEVASGDVKPEPALLTTYHPLIVEAHFSVLLTHLLLGDFSALVTAHARTVRLMDYLEGYPVFLPARSLNQSEYAEVLERLAVTWLKKREEQHISEPDGTEEQLAQEGDLKSLHHLLSFFTPSYVDALVAAAEKAEQELKEQSKAGSKSNPLLSLMDANGLGANGKERGSWAEEREKAEAERRKIDPSYATYNTARAEVAVAWLTAVVLPEKEIEEKAGRAKGKAPAEGRSAPSSSSATMNGSASTSKLPNLDAWTLDDIDDE